MTTQVRVLFLVAIAAMLAGWAGMRRGNDAIEARLAAGGAPAERAP